MELLWGIEEETSIMTQRFSKKKKKNYNKRAKDSVQPRGSEDL